MPLRITEESIEKDVAFLHDVDVKFISLVRHGANQMPFRVVKSDTVKGGDSKAMMVVHSILVPKHLELPALSEKEGLEWLAEANTEKGREFDTYRKFDQTDMDEFDPDSIKMVKIHDDGVWALTGSLKEDSTAVNVITLNKNQTKAAKGFPEPSPMDMPLAPTTAATVASFRDLFFNELDSMLSVVTGTLNQTAGSTKKRKSTVLNAIDSFRSFLVMGLDALGGEAAKIDDRRKKSTKEDDPMELFKDMDEFKEAVSGLITESVGDTVKIAVADAMKEAKKVADPAPEPKTDDPKDPKDPKVDTVKSDGDPKDDRLDKVITTVGTLAEQVKDLTKKWDNGLATEPAATQTDGDPDPDPKKIEEKSVFSGMLVSTPE